MRPYAFNFMSSCCTFPTWWSFPSFAPGRAVAESVGRSPLSWSFDSVGFAPVGSSISVRTSTSLIVKVFTPAAIYFSTVFFLWQLGNIRRIWRWRGWGPRYGRSTILALGKCQGSSQVLSLNELVPTSNISISWWTKWFQRDLRSAGVEVQNPVDPVRHEKHCIVVGVVDGKCQQQLTVLVNNQIWHELPWISSYRGFIHHWLLTRAALSKLSFGGTVRTRNKISNQQANRVERTRLFENFTSKDGQLNYDISRICKWYGPFVSASAKYFLTATDFQLKSKYILTLRSSLKSRSLWPIIFTILSKTSLIALFHGPMQFLKSMKQCKALYCGPSDKAARWREISEGGAELQDVKPNRMRKQ